ncbi:diaminopimelate epimerase [candidate division KSB1 bacterium]|nr:diaminopimelate epimerase [candidate division KSB1 bacterium]
MRFTKLTALGNDFILFDNRDSRLTGNEREFYRKICKRRTGVGADGVILLEQSDEADFKYRHFNSDGSEAGMCGNGARSFAYYLVQKGISTNVLQFEIDSVIYRAFVEQISVRIEMPPPREVLTEMNLDVLKPLEFGGFVDVRVPHLVLFSSDIQHLNVNELGKHYRHHQAFPGGTNVNFIQLIDSQTIEIRTFERGVENETLACGTGSVSSAIISALKKGMQPPIKVITRGGPLTVDFKEDLKIIYLLGEAKIVYEGDLSPFFKP